MSLTRMNMLVNRSLLGIFTVCTAMMLAVSACSSTGGEDYTPTLTSGGTSSGSIGSAQTPTKVSENNANLLAGIHWTTFLASDKSMKIAYPSTWKVSTARNGEKLRFRFLGETVNNRATVVTIEAEAIDFIGEGGVKYESLDQFIKSQVKPTNDLLRSNGLDVKLEYSTKDVNGKKAYRVEWVSSSLPERFSNLTYAIEDDRAGKEGDGWGYFYGFELYSDPSILKKNIAILDEMLESFAILDS